MLELNVAELDMVAGGIVYQELSPGCSCTFTVRQDGFLEYTWYGENESCNLQCFAESNKYSISGATGEPGMFWKEPAIVFVITELFLGLSMALVNRFCRSTNAI